MFTKNWLKEELKEFAYIFVATFLVDYGTMFYTFYNGDWSTAIAVALLVGVGKTAIKVIFMMILIAFGYRSTQSGFAKIVNTKKK